MDAPSTSSLAVDEPSGIPLDVFDNSDDVHHFSSLEPTFITPQPKLTEYYSGAAATHHNNNGAPASQMPQFDPRALLNPKLPNPKRPASSGEEFDRGRTDPTIAGQVSLVERLHNVQERTASPAKRIKTVDDEPVKKTSQSNFGGSSALNLQNPNGQPNLPRPGPGSGPSIDLTMSKCETHASSELF